MEKNLKFGKASKVLFVFSLVLGIVILILSALAIALAVFKSNGRREEQPLELPSIDDTAHANDNRLRLIETTDASRLSRKERISRGG